LRYLKFSIGYINKSNLSIVVRLVKLVHVSTTSQINHLYLLIVIEVVLRKVVDLEHLGVYLRGEFLAKLGNFQAIPIESKKCHINESI